MSEGTNIGINLDANSIKILKQVESIHRDSIINIGLSLVEKTGYFKTLSGTNKDADLEDVASLDVEQDEETKTTSKSNKKETTKEAAPSKKPTQSWDAF